MSDGLCECGCGRAAPIADRTDPRFGAVKGQPRRFIRGHSGHRWEPGYGTKAKPALPDNWRTELVIVQANGCWAWQGRVLASGYGVYGRSRVHRLAYEEVSGPVPDGLVLDHVCHNGDQDCLGGFGCLHRSCVNPDHLEAVTQRVNSQRGKAGEVSRRRAALVTHCPRGHEWTAENTIRTHRQKRCRECRREDSAANNARRRGGRAA